MNTTTHNEIPPANDAGVPPEPPKAHQKTVCVLNRKDRPTREIAVDDQMNRILRELPAARDELLALAAKSIEVRHSAILSENETATIEAGRIYEAVCYRLNGDTNFGSSVGPDGGAYVVAMHCRATPGEVPRWGQVGEFVIVVDEMRSIVKFRAGFGGINAIHLEFYAMNMHKPYISQTGYRSHFSCIHYGRTVDDVAVWFFREFLKKGRVMIEPQYRHRSGEGENLARLLNVNGNDDEIIPYEEDGGQFSFGF